jgi:hypothetical protein
MPNFWFGLGVLILVILWEYKPKVAGVFLLLLALGWAGKIMATT